MEEIASPTGPGADPINLTFKFVNVPLLNHQEQFFFYTRDTLNLAYPVDADTHQQ
jgi:hypothetical protein